MTCYQLAVVLLRLLGLSWAATGLVYLASELYTVFEMSWNGPGVSGAALWNVLIRHGVVVLLGAGCFLKATRLANLVCRGLFPEGCCQRCGYNLAPAGLTRCPECGHQAPIAPTEPSSRG